MAQDFIINSTTIARINKIDWADDLASQTGLDGYSTLLAWRKVTAQADGLLASEFNSLFALQGQAVTITIPPYDDRNADYEQYANVICERVDGRHDGPIFTGVIAEFRVRI